MTVPKNDRAEPQNIFKELYLNYLGPTRLDPNKWKQTLIGVVEKKEPKLIESCEKN